MPTMGWARAIAPVAGRTRRFRSVLLREPKLQRLVLGHEFRVTAQRITKSEALLPEIAFRLGQMKAVSLLRRPKRRLVEVVSDACTMRRVMVGVSA